MEAATLDPAATGREQLQSPQAVVVVLSAEAKDEPESLWVLHLDQHNQLLEKERLLTGRVVLRGIPTKGVLRKAVTNAAAKLITVRVPSNGTAELALEDIQFWRSLEIACEHLGIGFLDHLVVSGSGAHISCRTTIRTSFRKEEDGYGQKARRAR